jgi:ribosome-binding protein aMBF1 (putative translation factor)
MYQDWEPVVLNKAKPANGTAKPKTISPVQAIRKDDTELKKPQFLTGKSRSEMAQMRVSKGWTQKQLDMNGQFPANSCNGWEAGKLCPTGPQLQKLHRILGIKLERE